MGKISNLTKEQKIIFGEIANSDYIKNNFYFTGGTALSTLYLQHRFSDDLDFFSEKKFDNQIIFTLIQGWAKTYNFSVQTEFVEVMYIFNLMFPDNIPLKIDFTYYPYKRIEPENIVDGLMTDSLLDIAVNKVVTISQRTDVKDFVDLYFLLQKFSIWDLLEGAKVKFHLKIEPYVLASDFLKMEDFKFLPRMIKRISIEELQKFYRQKAKVIGKKAIQ